MSKKILYICNKAPHSNLLGKDCIDSAMVSAAFGQDIALLFLGDGVFQLLSEMDTSDAGMKNHCAAIGALGMYDVENTFVCSDSLAQRGIDQNQVQAAMKPLTQEEIQNLIQSHDMHLSF